MTSKESNDQPKKFDKRIIVGIIVVVVVAYVSIDLGLSYRSDRKEQKSNDAAQQESDKVVRSLVSSEELLLALTPQLKRLAEDVSQRKLPSSKSESLFAETVTCNQLSVGPVDGKLGGDKVRSVVWLFKEAGAAIARKDLKFWVDFFNKHPTIYRSKFYFVRGTLSTDTTFESVIGFDAKVESWDQRLRSVHAEIEVVWIRSGIAESSDPASWKIQSWNVRKFEGQQTGSELFKNILQEAIDDDELFKRVTESHHEKMISALIKGGDFYLPPGETYPFFFPDVTLEHPGVAVIDIDADGWDDFYVAKKDGKNLLFRNKTDGTFEEVANQYNLAIDGDSTSAIFADFDNDGDQDLFLGRARHRAMYLENRGGKYFDVSEQAISTKLPFLVSSISATDFNGDGLLDVYLSTYSPIEAYEFKGNQKAQWTKRFLTASQAKEYQVQSKGSHSFLSRTGPPNLLLVNIGNGKFKVAKANKQLELWRMTFQSSWHDFDDDGDPDLYVANDYAADQFFRNDGDDGFVDITNELGLTGMGFGMGVSFGDFDNDQKSDIYVSNMFSKAGQRITDQVEGIDARFQEMASGNFLYQKKDDGYQLVSGFEKSDQPVAKAGWSWGGQFLDFNNDGFRDIYTVSGYYTAPSDVAIEVDL